jgi:hypothetical protein
MTTTKHWNDEATRLLVGRTITNARYLTAAECKDAYWSHSAVIFTLDNGVEVIASSDDEGNNAGALFIGGDILPVIRL